VSSAHLPPPCMLQNGKCMPNFSIPEELHLARARSKVSSEADEIEQLIGRMRGPDVKTELVLRMLGLTHCRNTVVGGEMLRGISGGGGQHMVL
jgi:hypothetical protein